MASTLSTAEGELIPLDSELRDSLSFLEVLSANEFEGEQIDPDVSECDFYKGAPPKWMNFYLADEQASTPAEDQAVGVFKRDGYDKLRELIKFQHQGSWSVNTIRLMHHPGCGGTTLAMQVLWDLRKELRCAVLVDPYSETKVMSKPVQKEPPLFDIKAAAIQLIKLFTAGCPDKRNTVLLLQDNEHLKDPLQDCLIKEIREQKISATFPVVILLQCTRMANTMEEEENMRREVDVILKSSLSEKEKASLACKEQQILRQHRDELSRFYGFKIMQQDFNVEYVRGTLEEGKEIVKYCQRNRASRNTKLFAFLALISSYVPGSYLLQSQCEAFLSHPDPFAKIVSFEKRMEPFSDLIVTFSRHGRDDKRVRIAHPLLAHQCVQLLTGAGVTRSSATLDFLQYLCRHEIRFSLLLFFKEMLTKREMTPKGQEMFSKLTMDIENHEGIPECANVLQTASEVFKHDPFYPQALARLYYIKLSDYRRAEIWAEKAKERVPTNSFIADTLGQVHKNHLYKQFSGKTGGQTTARDILCWAEKAIKAFKQEEELALFESMTHIEDNPSKISYTFNNRGIFGYLQVANIVYYSLTKLNQKWRRILTHEISTEHLSALFEDKKLIKYKTFITSLRLEVEKKFYGFFESYLTYSEPRNWKDQTPYFQRDIVDCFCNYTRTPSQKDDLPLKTLKDKMVSTFPGISSLDKNTSESDLRKITELWKVIHEEQPDDINKACNYILANIIQKCRPMVSHEPTTLPQLKALLLKFMEKENSKLCSPEFYFLVILLFWPEQTKEEDIPYSIDINKYIECMKQAFENKFKKYLQSRELVPLFYLGKGSGLRRLVHKSNIDIICEQLQNSTSRRLNKTSGSAEIKDSWFRDHLLRVNGVVEDHNAFACMADKNIQICPQKQASVWKDGKITFYLGFNISGPMAFDIKYVKDKQANGSRRFLSKGSRNVAIKSYNMGSPKTCMTCDKMNESTHWHSIQPSVSSIEGVTMYRHTTPKGRHECRLSGLRWICKSDVILSYQFGNWEPYEVLLHAMQYSQGGPLLDVTVELGELEEVHLPHFACLGTDPSLRERMRILHVEDSGMSVERVQEVTRFHAKPFHPTFSPKGVLLKSGFRLKVHCDLMVYSSKKEQLSLRTYLIPSDRSQVEAVEKQERLFGFGRILVPRPERSLKMKSWFKLKTNPQAEIDPSAIQLRYHNTTPSFFRILVENLNIDLGMELMCQNDTVWKTCIHKAEIRETVFSKAFSHPVVLSEGFLKQHRADLIQRVTNAVSMADDLLSQGFIHQEAYSKVRAATTNENQMRELMDAVIRKGTTVEDAFVKALYKCNPSLVEDMINYR